MGCFYLSRWSNLGALNGLDVVQPDFTGAGIRSLDILTLPGLPQLPTVFPRHADRCLTFFGKPVWSTNQYKLFAESMCGSTQRRTCSRNVASDPAASRSEFRRSQCLSVADQAAPPGSRRLLLIRCSDCARSRWHSLSTARSSVRERCISCRARSTEFASTGRRFGLYFVPTTFRVLRETRYT